MSTTRLLPLLLPVAGFVAAAALSLYGLAIMEEADEELKSKKDKTDDLNEITVRIKEIQQELSRLHDIKDLNDRRESTKKVKKTTLQVNGVEISLVMLNLETEMNALVKRANEIKRNMD